MFARERIGAPGGSVVNIGAIVALIGCTLSELPTLAMVDLRARPSRVETY
jgi:hypothetical protein